MRLYIKTRLFIWFIIVSVIPLICIGGFSYYLIFNQISTQTEETITNINTGILNMVDTQQKVLFRWLESSTASFVHRLASLGESRFDYDNMEYIGGYRLPAWFIGNQKITNDYTLVNNLIENENLHATIFQLHNNEFIRVSTSVRQPDGTRIVGTKISSGPVYEKIINGQKYVGRANVEGIWHATIYSPIWDRDGNLIGAFVLGRREKDYELVEAIKNIVIGETGYVFIIDSNSNVIIHPNLEEKNVSKYPWVQEVLQKKNGSIQYDFKEREKIAYYTYYEPWDWYIVSSGYRSEIFNITKELSNILFFAIIAVILISSAIAYILSQTFSKPINDLTKVMRETQKGDMSIKLNYIYKDEFRIVSNGYNAMVNTISILIGRIVNNSSNLKEASKRLVKDIDNSMKSLNGIEKSKNNIKNYIENTFFAQSSNSFNDIYDDLYEKVFNIRLRLEKEISNNNFKELDSIIGELKEMELFLFNSNESDEEHHVPNTTSQSIISMNKINNLEIEIEKLRLLLSNISSSATSLDDIALALDRQVNKFKIDKEYTK
ncbi:MAG: methyl-accepting chemotaxis protein [Clostridia bacterium]|nr:methyl-accepting chemotaxis protein [Clostridia bacterium]